MLYTLEADKEFDIIFATYNKYAFTVCKNTISNRIHKYDFPDDLIMDILQISFTKLFMYMRTTDNIVNLKSLIAQITELSAINYLNKYIRDNAPLVDEFSEDEIVEKDSVPNPIDIILDDESYNEITALIKKLNPKYSSVILMKHVHNISLKEISDISGIPYNTICSWHTRGKRLLAKTLEERKNKNEG